MAPPASADPAPEVDSSAGIAAGNWLAAQAPDYDALGIGNTIDQVLALHALGGHEPTVQTIGAGVAGHLADYTDYAYCDDFTAPYEQVPCVENPEIDGVSAGAVGKALVGLQAAGVNPADVDGVNVVTKLEGLLPNTGDLTGRAISAQTSDGEPTYSGYTNVIGQSFVVRGLVAASSGEAAAATSYLIGLQCGDGSFKEDLPDESAAQTCAGTPSYSATSVDSTALAVLALDTVDSEAAATAVVKATDWLASVRQSSGGFASDGSTDAPNANSTGVATQALGYAVSPEAALKGVLWIREHQARADGTCSPFSTSDSGAIAYSDEDRTAGLADGITGDTVGTWLRATVQAAPALLWAPAGDGANVLFSAEYVKAGGTKPVGVTGADPGEQLCAQLGSQQVVTWADANGEASLPVVIPTKTATSKVSVYDGATKLGTATINALGAKRFPVAAPAKVRAGKSVRVVVRGLAPAETVKVAVRGKSKSGQANGKGVFVAVLKVTGKAGRAAIAVRGEFANRSGAKTVKVIR